jgi:molybdenum cofactor synthesis domain-containing protein
VTAVARPTPGLATGPPPATEVTVDEALVRVLHDLEPLPGREVLVGRALDAVLAETVRAESPLPAFDNSAMDGYAVRAADAASGRRLRVVGDVRAGQPAPFRVGGGEACRVMTGAPVPPGADAVVPFEHTRSSDSGGRRCTRLAELPPTWIEVDDSVEVGRHVRRVGEDVATGQVLAHAGSVVGPGEIALLSAVGRAHVRIVRPPVVAVLSTGDELSPPGEQLAPARVHDANGPALASLVRRAGGIPVEGALVRDRPEALLQRLESLAGSVDLVVTSGGASGGASDVVGGLVGSRHDVEALSVSMRPGKPLVVGRLAVGGRRVPLLGLPGNPVAAMVAFEVFAGPAIARLRGLCHDGVRLVEARSADALRATPGRVSFTRVRVERGEDAQLVARATGGGCGHGVRSLLGANALAVLPVDRGDVRPGDRVSVRLTTWSV